MLVSYSSDSDVQDVIEKKKRIGVLVNPTPDVDTSHLELQLHEKIESEYKKIFKEDTQSKKHLSGQVNAYYMNDFIFDEQFHNFKNYGFANDPTIGQNRIIVNKEKYPEYSQLIQQGAIIDANNKEFISKSTLVNKSKEETNQQDQLKKKREKFGNAATGEFQGPWAKFEEDNNLKQIDMTAEDQERLKKIKESREIKVVEQENEQKEIDHFKVTTEFFGDELRDYKGRSYIDPPLELKQHSHTCYIPKKCVHIYQGHTKGVQCIRFFPNYGHYLLSGSLDTTIKLWSVHGNKKLIRNYNGHTSAVRDLNFTNNGRHFLSAGYDKSIHYWDAETGQVIKSFRVKAFPYCARFNQEDSKQHTFLLGSSNKKIGQYDVRTGSRTQVYDEHLGAVNTITFIDNSRKFVSTSDDKKVFVWEFGIPVVIKHISEPDMHSISQTYTSPNHKYFIGQQQDNKVVVYDTKAGNFRHNRKKKFEGHTCSGYAIGIAFSADGQFVCSGDSEGRAFFWDWKTCKNYRVIEAHDGVCIGIEWHPIEPSKVATCGWDGLIKLWD